MSKAIEELRQHGGSFPGGLWNVLVELDQRLTALEQHAPMLNSLKPEYDAHMAAQAEPAGLTIVPDEPDGPGETDPAVQSLEGQQEPEPGAQGGQAS